MRDFKGMKRQRGRNRGGGGKPQHNANRAFDSNGPDGVKVRGNAQTVFEKYQQLARDATSSGDRVLAENYLQHAEHYFRLLRAMQPQRSPSEILGRDQVSSGLDIDFEDESGQPQGDTAEASETNDGEAEGERQPRERDRDEARRDENGGRRDDNNRREGRRDRWRDRDDRRERNERGDRPRGERTEREDRPERDPMAVVEPQAQPLVAETLTESPVLRDADGGQSEAPAFLQARPEPRAEGEDGATRRPRRRRAPRSFEGGEAAAGETEDA